MVNFVFEKVKESDAVFVIGSSLQVSKTISIRYIRKSVLVIIILEYMYYISRCGTSICS